MINLQKAKLVYCAIVVIAFLWNLAIIAAPWMWAHGHPTLSSILYGLFSPVCHQRAARSFFWFGHHWAACHRCSGIYLGALMGLLLFPLFHSKTWKTAKAFTKIPIPNRTMLFVALALVAADVGAEWLGVRASSPPSRFLTGAFCGIVTPFYLLPSIFEIFERRSGEVSPTEVIKSPATSQSNV
jgi:uncharacterized membrane protein